MSTRELGTPSPDPGEASQPPLPRHPLRVVCFGLRCPFSRPPLVALLDAGFDVAAVVLAAPPGLRRTVAIRSLSGPGAARSLPLVRAEGAPGIDEVARERGVPLLEVGRLRAPETLATLGELAPDAIAVACFPMRLPPATLALPRLGCLNVHPSLLPDNRGPEPLFWALRRGDRETGVTIHLMTERLDAGDILAQRRLPIPDGIEGGELERRCARLGGELLVESLRALAAGRARPRPQAEAGATTFPQPGPEDFEVTPDRPARWAFNFIRGARYWGTPFLHLDGERLSLADAVGYDPAARLGAPWRREGEDLRLQCALGVLHAKLSPPA